VNQHQKKKKKSAISRDLGNLPRKIYKVEDLLRIPVQLLCNPKYFWHLAAIFLIGELVVSTLAIHYVACNVNFENEYTFFFFNDINLITNRYRD
jgi:hypothetical protein